MAAQRHGDSDDGDDGGGYDNTDGKGDAPHGARYRHRLTGSKACAITPSGLIPTARVTGHDA